MNRAIVTLTESGVELGLKLQREIPGAVLYTMPGRSVKSSIEIHGNLKEFVRSIFNSYNTIIFIMAAGIVVRSISDSIRDKTTDPAVLVLDENGKFVISLLSGHLGGANRETEYIASLIGATPVITTSSDIKGMLAPDMLAKRYSCAIDDMKRCRDVTAVMVNGGAVALVSDYDIEFPYPYVSMNDEADAVIYLTNRVLNDNTNEVEVSGTVIPSLRLIPENIIIGTGCRKGTDPAALRNFIIEELDLLCIDRRAVCRVTSLDIKKNEPAVISAAEYFNSELIFYTSEDICKVEHMFQYSGFVHEKTGAGGVAEPCAYLASGCSGKMLLPKKKRNGMTIAVMERPIKETF